jgi:hypothetical protein
MVCRATPTTDIAADDDWKETNWSREISFANEKHWLPGSLTELVEVVARATENNKELRAIGSRWAFEDIATSADWVVDLRDLAKPLDYILKANPAVLTQFWADQLADPIGRRLVHVEAGIRVAAVSELLDSLGLALPMLGGANGQKLGGAISTSTHGGDWRQPPFPDLIRALHLVTDGGRELWIESRREPLTTGNTLPLPCADAELIRDDEVFKAAIVACGRFGVIYAVVLEVVPAFRVAEATSTPDVTEVLQALRDGIARGTLIFQPLFDLLKRTPAALPDAVGEPYFFQLVFNSQRPSALWATRRFITTNTDDWPAAGVVGYTTTPDDDLAGEILAGANAWLTAASIHAGGNPLGGIIVAAIITGIQVEMNTYVADHGFTLGNVAAAAVTALWKIHYDEQVRDINGWLVNQRLDQGGRRGPHYLITSGTREASDSESYKSASIELVFDATTTDYLDFLEEIFAVAPGYKQAGYVSLRPSLASQALISMHGVKGTFAMSIEIASLQGLPDNEAWMRYVHGRALMHHGRPHWGQYNKMDALDVAMTYGDALNRWREALLRVSGTSTVFSNNFCRTRGLEPTSIVREITGARRTPNGTITHVCNAGQPWSPVTREQAVRDIESGTIKYFVKAAGRLVAINAVGGHYLRTSPDDTTADNLDSLPGC